MKVNRNELKNTYLRARIGKGEYVLNPETNEEEWTIVKDNENPTGMFGREILLWCATFGAQIKNIEDLELDELYYLTFVGCGSHEITKVS